MHRFGKKSQWYMYVCVWISVNYPLTTCRVGVHWTSPPVMAGIHTQHRGLRLPQCQELVISGIMYIDLLTSGDLSLHITGFTFHTTQSLTFIYCSHLEEANKKPNWAENINQWVPLYILRVQYTSSWRSYIMNSLIYTSNSLSKVAPLSSPLWS